MHGALLSSVTGEIPDTHHHISELLYTVTLASAG
jgi:hypothetical protein